MIFLFHVTFVRVDASPVMKIWVNPADYYEIFCYFDLRIQTKIQQLLNYDNHLCAWVSDDLNGNRLNVNEKWFNWDRVVVVVVVMIVFLGLLDHRFDEADDKIEANRWVNCFTQMCTMWDHSIYLLYNNNNNNNDI